MRGVAHLPSFGDFSDSMAKYITIFDSQFYPDYIEDAKSLYEEVFTEFGRLLTDSSSSSDLLTLISNKPNPLRTQLMRLFRKYVSPDTSVEMLKKKGEIPKIIENFGLRFRDITLVRESFVSRGQPDESLAVLLYEYKDRGQKGYDLTTEFFRWFRARFADEFAIIGPEKAGKDVILKSYLPKFHLSTPADFLISMPDGTPLVVGFARYDSDRGGSQEDDRIKGNRDNVTEIMRYSKQQGIPLRILFLNDGPGLLLGSMWRDYASLEEYGDGSVLVATLKMLEDRVTENWISGK